MLVSDMMHLAYNITVMYRARVFLISSSTGFLELVWCMDLAHVRRCVVLSRSALGKRQGQEVGRHCHGGAIVP